ncbi:hypothetical protein PL11_007425 [Lentilactobacillus curieae]|uniref:LXG domain-containing protein n=1 Tax=Lentilactobacillus curieae TaxID=1138822 RepID=A0A1S6QJG9_9LACO|nr:hypothetical protein [Lentilactobacillus curieae]AQW21754.1 hypothetical protein PL11_007425 [Lentilactobacillus curieae]
MKQRDVQTYAKVISDVIDFTGTNGEDLNADFETLRKAVDNDSVSEISVAELTRIKDHFQSGTDKYQENVNKLQNASVPVRILGRHKTMVAAYHDYADACQSMTDSIDADNQQIDTDKFNQSEKDQENFIDKFSKAANRVMGSIM